MHTLATTRRRAALLASALLTLPALLAPAAASAFQGNWNPLVGLNSASGGGWVRALERDAVAPTTVYAATEGGGAFRSTNGGGSWSALSAGLAGHPARTVRAILALPGRVLAGTEQGVFVLNGSTWTGLGQGDGAGKLNASVQTLLSVNGTLLAGTFAGGVFRSSDDGQTWLPPGPGSGMPAGETVWSLRAFGSLVLAATSSGVYRSVDGGVTWTPAGDGIPPGQTTFRVFADSVLPNVWYAGTGSGVYRTLDAGLTWAPVSDGLPAGSNGAVRDLRSFATPEGTRLYAATGNGVYTAVVRLGRGVAAVRWSQMTTSGLAPNLIVWALSSLAGPDMLAGTQSDGGFGLTLVQPFSVGDPQIQGSAKVGATLTADGGRWGGTGTIVPAFEWQRCSGQDTNCSAIAGATAAQYVVAGADLNAWIRVKVRAENGAPTFVAPAEVSPSVKIGAAPGSLPGDTTTSAPDVTIDAPGVKELPRVGDVARVTIKTAMPFQTFNPNATTHRFEWLRCDADGNACAPIAGAANQSTYTLQTADAGLRVKARVTGSNVWGSMTLESANTTFPIIPDPALQLVAPALNGTAAVGETLVGNVGAWKSPRTTWQRQWQRCGADGSACAPILGATGAAYVVQPADTGKRLRMRVLADVNAAYELPAAVESFTPLSDVVPGGGSGGGGGGTGGGGGGTGGTGGGGGEGTTPADRVAPRLGGVALTKSRFAAGAKGVALRYRLSEAATLRIAVQRLPRRRGAKPKTVATVFAKGRKAGAGAVAFNGRIGRKSLAAGRHRLLVTPVDGAGNRGRAVAVAFRIVRR
jgi:hypothetical protein